jgi:formate dehydrogenase
VVTFGDHEFGQFFNQHVHTDDGRVDCCPADFTARFPALEAQFAALAAESAETLKLISLREARMMNSWYSNVPRLRTRSHQHNPLHLHPVDAARLGLAEGEMASLTSAAGSLEVSITLDEDLLPGVVAMTHGWGHAETTGMRVAQAFPGVNCNRLLPIGAGSFDPLSGQAHMTGIPVALRPRAPG